MAEPVSPEGDPTEPVDDIPFDDEPFDAGVEADEQSDPKKFIEQLSGKIGQALRSYTEKQGSPDFEVEKFAINSLLAATHTSEMEEDDRNDIIDKVNKADGAESEKEPESEEPQGEEPQDEPQDEPQEEPMEDDGFNEALLGEDEQFVLQPKKLTMYSDESGIEAKTSVKENLVNSQEYGKFVNKKSILMKLHESFNQEAPAVAPVTKPNVAPTQPKPSRRSKPFLPVIHPSIKPAPKASVDEVKKKKFEYDTYHRSYSSAVNDARIYAESLGYTIDEDSWSTEIAFGPKKPKEGDTNSVHIQLLDEKGVSKKLLHIQVYGMATSYELNCYVA